MKKGWTTTKLTAIGGLAVLATVLGLFGAGIAAITGIPGTSGFITVFTTPAMVILCCFIIDRFGAVTIMEFIHAILEIPLPLTGAPGFLFKVPILVIGGIIVDLLYLILKKSKKISALVIGEVYIIYGGLAVIIVGRLVDMPGVEKATKFLSGSSMIVLAFIGGTFGGYLGYFLYGKIKDTAAVKRIQG
jgi:hypothetical protein